MTITDFNGFKLKKSRLDKEEITFCEDGKKLVEFAQGNSGCRVAGSVLGKVGWGFEHPGPMEGVAAHGREIGNRWSGKVLSNTSCSMIL